MRTPRPVRIARGERVIGAAGGSQEMYVIPMTALEIPGKSEHSADNSAGAPDKHAGSVLGINRDGFAPVDWLFREITSFLLGSEMEEPMKPESAVRNEKEMRAPAPAVMRSPEPENLSALTNTPDDGTAPRHERIQARAYELFVERGSRDGGDVIDWLDAEQELEAQQPKKSYRAGAGGKSA